MRVALRSTLAATTALLVFLVFARVASAKQVTIDDFEAATSPSPWVFTNGPEFPGATGSLAPGPGDPGKGAALSYDFTKGGSYVEMTLTLPTPLTVTAIGFTAKASGVRTGLRLVDSTGQNFQYLTARPLEAGAPDAWFSVVVDLSAPGDHWSGANDGIVHQPITAVSLLAGNALQPGLAGVAGFDDVVGWDVLPATLDPTAPPIAAPAGAGDLKSRLGVNIHFTSDDQALDIIAAAGFSRVRMDLGWGGVETTKGVYDFSAFDALVASLASRGLSLHLILDYFNPLYPDPTDAGLSPTTVTAFAAVSKAAAAHFAGEGVTYEVWNEENGGFWPPAASPAQYAPLCAAAIAAVHEGDPAALVTTGGLAGFDPAFLEAMLDAGAGAGANALGVHPYRQGGAESASDDLAYMRATIAAAYTTPPPVWDTEWGYSSTWYGGDAGGTDPTARAIQAQRVSRELLSAWALGFPMEIYYDVRDDGTDPANQEHNFGLVQNDYGDKPAVVAVRTLSKVAAGRTFSGFLPVGFTSMHAMLLVGPIDRVVALWNDAPGSVTSVAVPPNGAAVDMLGAPVALVADGGSTTVTVSEVAGPIFLTYPNPSVSDAGASDGGAGEGGKGPGDVDGGVTDAAAAPADGGTSGADAGAGTSHASSGCGCTAAGGTSAAGAIAALVALLAAALRRRRLRS
ncbi:MAG TPA: cellulase family glycosylhydrolase [Polyangiaceae bacterium]|jgi:MYXO-CTERM domain-containing protein